MLHASMHVLLYYADDGWPSTILVEMFISDKTLQDENLQNYIDTITSAINNSIVQKQSPEIKGNVK